MGWSILARPVGDTSRWAAVPGLLVAPPADGFDPAAEGVADGVFVVGAAVRVITALMPLRCCPAAIVSTSVIRHYARGRASMTR